MKIYYNPKLKQLARNLRNDSTLAEILLWNELKGCKMLGFQFMRQKPIGNYIVDFYCPKLKLVIKVDGETHRFKPAEDIVRQDWIEKLGIHFLRFDDLEVKREMDRVLQTIENWIMNNQ